MMQSVAVRQTVALSDQAALSTSTGMLYPAGQSPCRPQSVENVASGLRDSGGDARHVLEDRAQGPEWIGAHIEAPEPAQPPEPRAAVFDD